LKSIVEKETFDIILANINRNILLNDMRYYVNAMKSGSILLISGLYKEDIVAIVAEGNRQGLTVIDESEESNWAAVAMRK